MHNYKLLDTRLNLFDGGGDGGGASAAGGEGAASDTTGSPAPTRPGKKSGAYDNVVFGKQPDATVEAMETEVETPPAAGETAEESFADLIKGKHKDAFTAETQKIIDRRFKQTKGLEQTVAAQQPLIEMMAQRYGVQPNDVAALTKAIESDTEYWQAQAEQSGMSTEQYMQVQKLQRENAALKRAQEQSQQASMANAQMAQWAQQADALKAQYPEFDLGAECQNRQFLSLLRAGVPVQHAYEVMHMDKIKAAEASRAAKATEQQVVNSVKTKAARPSENGTNAKTAFTVKDDVSKLSKKDRAEIARRAARGEMISF